MKKLIYSTLGLIIAGSMILTGCKKDDDNNGSGNQPATPKPIITFQNTSGYTFADAKVLNTMPTAALKFGMVVTSTIDLKSVKVTRNYQGSGEVVIYSNASVSGLNFTIDILDTLKPGLKGAYVYTFSALDKDATTGSTAITITATGPLFELTAQRVWNNKGAGMGAYDLVNGTEISSLSPDKTIMDILDQSTTSTIEKSWGVGAGCTTMFIKGPFAKQYSQLLSEDDVKALWEANASKATNKLTAMEGGIGMMILVKVSRTATPVYYAMTIDDIVDDVGADNDYTEFTYKY